MNTSDRNVMDGMNGMNIQKIPTADIKAAKYNPRKDLKPGDAEYEKLKRSIETFGYVEPLIWNKRTGNLVGGHQRFKVLKQMGFTEIDCVVVELGNSEEKALNVALNKIGGEFDVPLLTDLLKELKVEDFDVSLTGFDLAELEKMFEDACIGRDVQKLVEEVISHLTSADGAQVEVSLEVNVNAPDGMNARIVRTVSENCRTLRVQNFGFDE